MSTLVTQLYLLEKYGPRLTTEQLAEVLTSDAGTILNQVSAGTFGVPTYVRTWARHFPLTCRIDAMLPLHGATRSTQNAVTG